MGAEQSAPATQANGDAANGDVGTGAEQQQQNHHHPAGKPSALVIVGPSGVGKGTLISALVKDSGEQFGFSVSHTTRAPRTGEKHGEHYYFTTKEQFAKEVAEGKFLEYAEVHGNLYGTSIGAVRKVLDSGKVCILDIDVQGARAVRRTPLRAIFVFVAPPSLEDLAKRLVGRGTENMEQVKRRLGNAKAEINSLNERGLYDYLIINDNLEEAAAKLKQIAARASQGLEPEPGQVPESVIIEDAPLPDILLSGEPEPEPVPAEAEAAALAAPAAPAAEEPAASAQAQQLPAADEAPAVPAVEAEPAPEPELVAEPEAEPSPAAPEAQPAASSAAPAAPAAATPAEPAPSVMPGLEKWQGKVALVTGASSGIGWATCEALALNGLRVVAVARRKDRLEALQQHMHSMGVLPQTFLPVVCDITKDAEVATLPKIVAKRWPDAGIDVLVNNAGLSRNDASMFDGNVASWVEMLSTNVLGTCMMTKAVLQDMRRRGSWGHIINMVGLSGHRIPDGPQGGGFYCATKSAVKTITEGLRQEARGQQLPLRVSGISPGIVETEFFAVRNYGDLEAARRSTSQFPCLQPADIAQAVLWCLSAPEHVEVNDVVVRPTAQLI